MNNLKKTIDQFIIDLKKINPKNYDNIPDIITKGYELKQTENPNFDLSKIKDPILYLIHSYEAKYIMFGDFSLQSEVFLIGQDYTVFGRSSHSFLTISHRKNGQIIEVDRETLVELEPVAKNSYSFLKA